MALITKAVNLFFSQRLKEIERFKRHPEEVQAKQFRYLMEQGAATKYGQQVGLKADITPQQYRERVPVVDYDTIAEVIDRSRRGEQNIVWPTDVKWFAKSSGTTGSKSKYIPVTTQGLHRSHMRGPKDIMAMYCDLYPATKVVNGKLLALGGSKRIEREGDHALSGDLSAILIENTPAIANVLRIPDKKTALIPDFDEKVRRICEKAVKRDVRSFTGVPSWNLVMLNRVLEYTGKDNILEVWPHMELFAHGGMDFRPYEAQYRKIIPSDTMRYMETYNASEGFFAIAQEPGRSDMLLMLDYGTYYEFLPTDQLDKPQNALPISQVRTGVNYAMIITSCNGLWRYMIGDTVEFISTSPYTVKITGRTKHYINAFGEEIVIDNAESAIYAACRATGAEVVEYTAGPIYMKGRDKGAHEWVIEFHKMPDSLEHFTDELDRALQGVNSDYEAKRFKNTTLDRPLVTVVPRDTFVEWLRSRGMVGGQNKVPRLFNDRTWVDQLIEFIPQMEQPRSATASGPKRKSAKKNPGKRLLKRKPKAALAAEENRKAARTAPAQTKSPGCKVETDNNPRRRKAYSGEAGTGRVATDQTAAGKATTAKTEACKAGVSKTEVGKKLSAAAPQHTTPATPLAPAEPKATATPAAPAEPKTPAEPTAPTKRKMEKVL